MRKIVIEFKIFVGVEADGVVVQKTAKELFRHRINQTELLIEIPDHLTLKQTGLESNFDPSAFVDHGSNGADRSLNQINSNSHPEVSDDQAYDPSFSIPWAAKYLKDAINAIGDVDAGLAAYNVGRFYARKWLEAGKPTTGLYTSSGKDYAKICTNYVYLVKKQIV
jgi:soluble lytic murein transglycosylase-like protein